MRHKVGPIGPCCTTPKREFASNCLTPLWNEDRGKREDDERVVWSVFPKLDMPPPGLAAVTNTARDCIIFGAGGVYSDLTDTVDTERLVLGL